LERRKRGISKIRRRRKKQEGQFRVEGSGEGVENIGSLVNPCHQGKKKLCKKKRDKPKGVKRRGEKPLLTWGALERTIKPSGAPAMLMEKKRSFFGKQICAESRKNKGPIR